VTILGWMKAARVNPHIDLPPPPVLSLIVPVYNEEGGVGPFLERVRAVLSRLAIDYEIIFVDDGSSDRTADCVISAAERDPRIRLIQLSRNFGKEAALTAGLDWAAGEAAVPIDIDMQDPPELLADFVRYWREGYEIVYARRVSRKRDSSVKRGSAHAFYRVFNFLAATPIEENVGDYRLLSRPAIQATLSLRERNRFMKGLFAWVGFRSIAVDYERPDRVTGRSKFNLLKLWNFALDGITSFSTLPLRVWTYVGLSVALFSVGYTIFIIVQTMLFGRTVPGYASLMVVVLLLGAVQLISLGVMGEYLGRLYLESKQRPIYIVRRTVGLLGRPDQIQEPARPTLAYPEWVPGSTGAGGRRSSS
jgi:polyisoprenyl-phosphate glycosyltransferase